MVEEFREHVKNTLPFLKKEKLLIACSGGLDSVLLVWLSHSIGLNIQIAHCNFKLRGQESDKDAIFVRELAQKLDIECFTTTFDTDTYAKKYQLSIQMAARKLRYQWFEHLAKTHTFAHILTAHHQDDSLETFLINLSRGTGIDGLLGIPEINGSLVRPLLPFSREEIIACANKNQIKWREDASNKETKYLRNKIRHDIIPVLKTLNPQFLQNFNTTTKNLKQTNNFINNEIKHIKKDVFIHKESGEIAIDIGTLMALGNPEEYLYMLLKEYGFTAWSDIKNMLSAQSGKQIFSDTYRLIKDRKSMLLTPIINEVSNRSYTIPEQENMLMIPSGALRLKEVTQLSEVNLKTVYVDKEKLKYPLVVRKWEEGDYFYPLGMTGKKKLSKYFKDEKLSLLAKERVWLLCSENAIVWIINYRADDRFKIKPQTKSILKITMT